jgi:hypothetical protein
LAGGTQAGIGVVHVRISWPAPTTDGSLKSRPIDVREWFVRQTKKAIAAGKLPQWPLDFKL